jgi:hypothetical protein
VRTVRIWEALATHYKDEPTICGYGLLNEPVPPENSPLTTAAMYDRLYDAVRAIDSRHAVVLGAFFNFDALGSPESNGWTNVVYETHHYDDGNKTAANQQNFVAGNLQYLRGYQQLWQVPILAGEFNFWSAEDAWRTWLYALNETGISWSNWTYKHTDLERDNNWGLYYQPTEEKMDYARDSYAEIARKWRGYATENYTKNEFLTEIFTWATAENERMETAKTSFTAQAYQTDGDNAAKLLLDEDIFTRWSNCEVQGNGANQWIEVDFGETLNLSGIGLFTWNNDYTRAYKVLADIEGEWRVIARGNGRFGRTEITFEPLLTDKIRIAQTGKADWNYWSVYELSFYTA